MKADKIIKNAKIFTADKNHPSATALVVKDGKFAYVGDEAGLKMYEGDVTDLGGKFIMPSLIDSHVHITTGVGFEYLDLGVPVMCSTKKGMSGLYGGLDSEKSWPEALQIHDGTDMSGRGDSHEG